MIIGSGLSVAVATAAVSIYAISYYADCLQPITGPSAIALTMCRPCALFGHVLLPRFRKLLSEQLTRHCLFVYAYRDSVKHIQLGPVTQIAVLRHLSQYKAKVIHARTIYNFMLPLELTVLRNWSLTLLPDQRTYSTLSHRRDFYTFTEVSSCSPT